MFWNHCGPYETLLWNFVKVEILPQKARLFFSAIRLVGRALGAPDREPEIEGPWRPQIGARDLDIIKGISCT